MNRGNDVTDVPASKRRRRKREIRPEIDRRTSVPFNGETVDRVVADPYSTTGGKIAVTASLRDDPLGRLYAHRHIDEGQYRAGLKLLELFELAEIGSVQAMDPGKEPVDGRGALVEPITDRQMRAARQLAFVRSVLGQVGYDLCRAVLAEGATMELIAGEPATQPNTQGNGGASAFGRHLGRFSDSRIAKIKIRQSLADVLSGSLAMTSARAGISARFREKKDMGQLRLSRWQRDAKEN
jgi:hypothetical protein